MKKKGRCAKNRGGLMGEMRGRLRPGKRNVSWRSLCGVEMGQF